MKYFFKGLATGEMFTTIAGTITTFVATYAEPFKSLVSDGGKFCIGLATLMAGVETYRKTRLERIAMQKSEEKQLIIERITEHEIHNDKFSRLNSEDFNFGRRKDDEINFIIVEDKQND